MMLPEILIYKHRSSLEEFCIDEDGCYNKRMFEVLLNCKDVVNDIWGDLEVQYLSLFNTAHYLCADIIRSKFPFLKTQEYYDYIRSNVKGGPRREDAVVAMVLVMLYPYVSEERIRLVDSFRKRIDRSFLNIFFNQFPPVSDFSIIGGPWLAFPMLTEAYIESNKKKMLWRKWTNDFSEREIRTLVMSAGISKEERLNLLDAIAIEAKNNGFEEAFGALQKLYEQVGMEEDSRDGYKYRTRKQFEVLRELKGFSENPLKTENDELKRENKLKEKCIKECENKISVLENNLAGVRKEYFWLMDEYARLNIEYEKLKRPINENSMTEKEGEKNVININIHGSEIKTQKVEQVIGVAESGSLITHTDKK